MSTFERAIEIAALARLGVEWRPFIRAQVPFIPIAEPIPHMFASLPDGYGYVFT
jgi:hypothetical protein